MSAADANPDYWVEYTNLQHVKHAVIRNYLNGWFPKMTLGPTGVRRLLYIDTHAGRGKHLEGQLGSPLVALTTLLDHASRDRMLQTAEVRYNFIERDAANLAALRGELAKHTLPPNVYAEAEAGDCFEIIKGAIAEMEKRGGRMAPGFVFVDPYGFKLPGGLLKKLIGYPKVELFINVIWRELDMAIRLLRGEPDEEPPPVKRVGTSASLFDDLEQGEPNPAEQAESRRREERRRAALEASRSTLEATLDSVFAGDAWRRIDAPTSDARADQCAALFRQIAGARWGTHFRMMDNSRVRYFLLHLTNHPDGRDLMKECMWKACPHGGFYASKADRPDQVVLIEPEPDLRPLREWVATRLAAAPKRWNTLTTEVREELWLSKHLNEVIRDMRNRDKLIASGYTGQFAQVKNPLLSLPTSRVTA